MASSRSDNDGVVNPAGIAIAGVAPPLFVAAVPLASYLSQPNGLVEKLVNGLISTTVYVGSAGASSTVSSGRTIPALSALYLFAAYVLGGSTSASALDMGNEKGRSNNYPRKQVANLDGLPLRMHSAHAHMMETFGGYALAASLSMALAPTNQHIVNLLGLHVISKLFVFWPSYLANVGPARSIGHLLSVSSLIGVAWKLARGAA